MPFFRFALVCCAIFTAGTASAGGRFFRRRVQPKAACQVDLGFGGRQMPWLNLLRKPVHVDDQLSIDRTEVAEWRTVKYTHMTYEMFGSVSARATLLQRVAEAAVEFLRHGGRFTDDVKLVVNSSGHLVLDLPIGAPSAAFCLMLEKRLSEDVALPPGLTDAEQSAIQRWLMTQPIRRVDADDRAGKAFPERFARDAAE